MYFRLLGLLAGLVSNFKPFNIVRKNKFRIVTNQGHFRVAAVCLCHSVFGINSRLMGFSFPTLGWAQRDQGWGPGSTWGLLLAGWRLAGSRKLDPELGSFRSGRMGIPYFNWLFLGKVLHWGQLRRWVLSCLRANGPILSHCDLFPTETFLKWGIWRSWDMLG